ncbi:BTB domain-containing protein [Mycena sanguinolenta]|uniref:BTB domain-containing protein n=1 Tax=Mycena sanguinolenta TaxID=230812 RepID=A0A8H7DFK6_9AGAR|nr:BTB domain-containing protein [Mycena sanguinolenta]
MSSPAKRQRTENASITRENAPIKHSDLWIDDGNVVLQAGNIQFRVHWGVLARNSSIFRGMRGLPQPLEQPSVEGCLVVELSDDPSDVEYLLNTLYTPSALFDLFGRRALTSDCRTFVEQKRLPLPVVGALIRLGRKYDFKALLDSAVARVSAECPTTLAEYDKVPLTFKTIEWYRGAEFDLLALVSENNMFAALPCACYHVVYSVGTPAEFFDGILKEDGTRTSLSHVDLRRCVLGHHKLVLKQFEPGYLFGWTRKWEYNDCTSSVVCGTSREVVLETYMEDHDVWALTNPSCLSENEFCTACTEHVTECIAIGRKNMWEELPEIFDLPGWIS